MCCVFFSFGDLPKISLLNNTFSFYFMVLIKMDPFGSLFSFINRDASQEEEQVPQDIDNNIEKKKRNKEQKAKTKLLQSGCKLCEEGQVHEDCTEKRKTKGRKTDGEFACDKCDYTCDRRKSFDIHIEGVHLKQKNFKCSLCSHSTYNRANLQYHTKKKHKGEKNSRIIKIGCSPCELNLSHKVCEGTTKAKKKYGKYGKYKCDQCEYTNDRMINLRTHTETVHLKLKRFKCSGCDYAAYRRNEMLSHIKFKHRDENLKLLRKGCPLCEKNEDHQVCVKPYKTSIKVNRNRNKNEAEGRTEMTKRRKLREKTNKNANNKEAVVRKSRSISCEECGESFDSIKSFRDHESRNHSDIARFSCNLCDFMGYFKILLQEHQKEMHEGLPTKIIKIGCEESEKNIEEGRKDANLVHDISLDDKRKCLLCDFSSNGRGITLHTQKVHYNLMRYECSECGHKTFFKKFMKLHIKSKHKKEKATFLYLLCNLCTKGDDHEEHNYTKSEKKYTKKERSKCNFERRKSTEKKKGITKSEKPRNWNGKLKTDGSLKCAEENCDFATDCKQSLQVHNDTVHKGILNFKCNICDFKSYHHFVVKNHQKSKSHLGKKVKILKIGCTFCEEDTLHTEHSNSSGIKRESKIFKENKDNFKCLAPKCTYYTYSKHNVSIHHHIVHLSKDIYSCNLCDYTASNTKQIRAHQIYHKGEETRIIGIGCKLCEENIEHIRHKLPPRPFDYAECYLCKNGTQHSEHEYKTIHNSGIPGKPNFLKTNRETEIECSICKVKLLTKGERVKHYQKEHPGYKIFNCQDCKYATNYLPNLNTHRSSMHERKVRQCPHCSYNSTWNTSFLEHMRNAHGLFQKKSKHSVESEGEPILCDDCGFSTFNQKHFNSHKLAGCQSELIFQYKRSHIRSNWYVPPNVNQVEMKVGNFKCNKCGFSSDKPQNIRDHVQMTHAQEQNNANVKPKVLNLASNPEIKFKCNKCKFQTIEPLQLREHMTMHA